MVMWRKLTTPKNLGFCYWRGRRLGYALNGQNFNWSQHYTNKTWKKKGQEECIILTTEAAGVKSWKWRIMPFYSSNMHLLAMIQHLQHITIVKLVLQCTIQNVEKVQNRTKCSKVICHILYSSTLMRQRKKNHL